MVSVRGETGGERGDSLPRLYVYAGAGASGGLRGSFSNHWKTRGCGRASDYGAVRFGIGRAGGVAGGAVGETVFADGGVVRTDSCGRECLPELFHDDCEDL